MLLVHMSRKGGYTRPVLAVCKDRQFWPSRNQVFHTMKPGAGDATRFDPD